MTEADDEHVTAVAWSALGHHVTCSCGQFEQIRDTADSAEGAGRDHVRAQFYLVRLYDGDERLNIWPSGM